MPPTSTSGSQWTVRYLLDLVTTLPGQHVVCTLVVLMLIFASGRAAAGDHLLLIEVVINGHTTGKIGEFTQRDGTLWARRSELRELGFRLPDTAGENDGELLALPLLPGIGWRLNEAAQTLDVTAATDSLLPTVLKSRPDSGTSSVPFESGSGVVFDYDLVATSASGDNQTSGLFDLRAFSPWGVASSGLLARFGGAVYQPRTVRLDTSYTYSDPETLRRYRLGDFISGGLSWTRPVRLGGARISSDFSMRPDLVTFPLPSLRGAATVPSTVDVLVSGQRSFSREVPPGPFEVPQLPVMTGVGMVTLNVTDALGRQTTETLPFYASSALLAPNLQTFSAEVGALRRNWGSVSNSYGASVASASYRRGLSSRLTVEAHAEVASRLFMGGGGVVANLADLAVFNLAAAGSGGGGRSGIQATTGIQHLGQAFSLGASATFASRQFGDLGALDGDPVPWRQLFANAGLSLGRAGSFGIAYTGINRDLRPIAVRWYGAPTSPSPADWIDASASQHQRMLSASYSVQLLGKVSLYVTTYKDFASGGGNGAMVGLTLPFGGRSSASVSAGSSGGSSYTQVQAMQSANTVGDWGYRLYRAGGDATHETAELDYKSPWALISLGADHMDQQTAWRGQARGALAATDGGLFATNTINDSFAVVDTGGAPDIRVRYENRDMGRTDGAGRLLVPELRSFEVNHLSIEPTDVPADASITVSRREVRPMDRSGVVVKFPVKISHGALLRLVDAAGRPLPLGSVVTLTATGVAVSLGYDGEAYAEDLQAHNEVRVQRPDGRECVARFDYRPTPGDIPTLGPLPCQEPTP